MSSSFMVLPALAWGPSRYDGPNLAAIRLTCGNVSHLTDFGEITTPFIEASRNSAVN